MAQASQLLTLQVAAAANDQAPGAGDVPLGLMPHRGTWEAQRRDLKRPKSGGPKALKKGENGKAHGTSKNIKTHEVMTNYLGLGFG